MSEAAAEQCGPHRVLNVEVERSYARVEISPTVPLNRYLRRRLSHVVYGVAFQPLA